MEFEFKLHHVQSMPVTCGRSVVFSGYSGFRYDITGILLKVALNTKILTQLSRAEVWDPINRFNPAMFLCLSQFRIWISIVIGSCYQLVSGKMQNLVILCNFHSCPERCTFSSFYLYWCCWGFVLFCFCFCFWNVFFF